MLYVHVCIAEKGAPMKEESSRTISFTVNGEPKTAAAERSWTLLYLLRDVLGLTGTKYGCGTGDCGSCRVLIDGEPKPSCIIPAFKAEGCSIVTIEGIEQAGRLSILQQSFIDAGAVQCGFCTPGMIITGTALLASTVHPTEKEIRKAFSKNLCRCTGYVNIVKAVELASQRIRKIQEESEFLSEVRNEA